MTARCAAPARGSTRAGGGAAVAELGSSEERIGYAIALGADAVEAMEAAAKATAGVHLEVSPPSGCYR